MITYIYGPPGSGKTQHAETLRTKYRCLRIIDEWPSSVTTETLRHGDLVLGQRLEDAPKHSRVITIMQALS